MSANSELVARFTEAMDGPIDTGGRAAVALRCDHGLAPFREKVLPVTRRAGIRVSQAYNPRNWHYPENQGVAPDDLNSWVAAGDVEIWNHSASHGPAKWKVELVDEIVASKHEIEEQVPAAGTVWGWNPPGLPAGNYGGFDSGKSVAGWSTPAARMILKHHAVASGSLPGTLLHDLDGTPRVGLARYQLDSRPLDEILSMIDRAVDERKGLQLMVHPSVLDRPGKITTPGFEAVIGHVVKRRDEGRLVTLSPYQLLVADSSRT